MFDKHDRNIEEASAHSCVSLIMQGEAGDGTSFDEHMDGTIAMVMVLDEEKAELKAFGSMTDPMAFHAIRLLKRELEDIYEAFPHAAMLSKFAETVGPYLNDFITDMTDEEECDE